ncbi:hypothetical protein CFC21_064084 [Triticum aestivum]|uniref:Transmembrane protein 107 n=2 Tax=Triticum aestivum TaxID=4565 RepID=A0A9R1H0Z7_WHEAT|nr:uncharacterized protein LOC123106447 [Triticum aestivum]KAF7056704.1 hypothetical protein CFC21_064084 [Triticum aestivum]
MDGKKPKIPADVRRASQWALVNASFHLFSFFAVRPSAAYAVAGYEATCSECVALTDKLSGLWLVMLWCAAAQAAAAGLALMLPCRDNANLALRVTIVGHYMYAVAVRLLLEADPGFLLGWIVGPASIVVFAGADFVCFRDLLQLGDD